MDNLKMKSCSKCKVMKDMSFFVGVKNQETKTCKVCRDAEKRHRQKHKEKINARKRKYGKKKFECPCGRVISNNYKKNHQYESFTHIMYLKDVDEEKYKKCWKRYKDKYPILAEKNMKNKEEEDKIVKEWMELYYGDL